MSRSTPTAFPRFLREYPLGVLGFALLVTILFAPLIASLDWIFSTMRGPARLLPFTLLVAAAATFAIWNTARSRAITVCLASLAAILVGISSLVFHEALIAAHLIAQTVFLGYAVAVVTRTVFTARVVDGNILCGAACVYLLAGVLFGYIYSFIEYLHPGSFVVTASNLNLPQRQLIEAPGWLIYFSFTTLTTVGFGDILPSSNVARSAAVFEAVLGQIMLVVMIARLVGLHVAHSTHDQPRRFKVGDEPDRT
ncbi:MAG TPA: potassium channel family protein [Chthoniobacterales bacterium]